MLMRKPFLTRTRQLMPKPIRLLLCICLFGAAFYPAIGQDKKTGAGITLDLVNRPVSEALASIEKQSAVTFHFDKTNVDVSRIISIHLEKASLNEALGAITRLTGYQFRQKGDRIMIVGATPIPSAVDTSGNTVNGRVVDS